ncbi:hypothetical protein Tph_c18170 [Thermacetogenium phaeum DSM 12270]|jgi:hypothetical protein|uniref:Uncharacterized protein n=1 Tax=Thermacetogenium phaeum (strain ATCC BAA-254 / DSM 26808 / PB) TaxID=1089553 RepID=K4LIX3_THEPS|nr:hypothetical protein Tph_c18170 [Thermacetogenium phaeum DSM 12270]MDN5376076.1 hypothetical protein [Thermacetogenium sp.]
MKPGNRPWIGDGALVLIPAECIFWEIRGVSAAKAKGPPSLREVFFWFFTRNNRGGALEVGC